MKSGLYVHDKAKVAKGEEMLNDLANPFGTCVSPHRSGDG